MLNIDKTVDIEDGFNQWENKLKEREAQLECSLTDIEKHRVDVIEELKHKREEYDENIRLLEEKREMERGFTDDCFAFPDDPILDLNVGGGHFTTLRSTVRRVEDSMMGAMFSGRWPITRSSDGRCFIDKDPAIFKYVLAGLRHENMEWPIPEKDYEKQSLAVDLDYFCLKMFVDDILASCRYIYVMSGYADGSRLSCNECFDTSTGSWSICPSMPIARSCFAAVSIDSMIYAIGGSIGGGDTNHVHCYDTSTQSWSEVASMSEKRSDFAAVSLNGLIYAIGGYYFKSSVECFIPDTNTWKSVANLIEGRRLHSAAVLNGLIYVTGGCTQDQSNASNSVEYFDPNTHKWSAAPPMINGRRVHSSISYSNRLYVIGGVNQGVVTLSSIECFDSDSNQWSHVTDLPIPVYRAPAACIDGNIYVIGGREGNYNYLNNVQCYDINNNKWSQLAPMPTPRAATACAVI